MIAKPRFNPFSRLTLSRLQWVTQLRSLTLLALVAFIAVPGFLLFPKAARADAPGIKPILSRIDGLDFSPCGDEEKGVAYAPKEKVQLQFFMRFWTDGKGTGSHIFNAKVDSDLHFPINYGPNFIWQLLLLPANEKNEAVDRELTAEEKEYVLNCDQMVIDGKIYLRSAAYLLDIDSVPGFGKNYFLYDAMNDPSKDEGHFNSPKLYRQSLGVYGVTIKGRAIPQNWNDGNVIKINGCLYLGNYSNPPQTGPTKCVQLTDGAYGNETIAGIWKNIPVDELDRSRDNQAPKLEDTPIDAKEKEASRIAVSTEVINAEAKAQEAAQAQPEKQTWTAWLISLLADILGFIFSTFAYLLSIIFNRIVQPILVALLSVKPWQDAFVSLIYPGWLIMRNLANIAFIVSLLVVGLRVLFQVEDAAKSRSFLKTLIIMALLVNFSLVIAQGAVAIADTVQSQFLPANSEVLYALGNKLMVEPFDNIKGTLPDTSVADAIAKLAFPFVLLFLAVASFFAFIGIAGFIFIRLCALMVLYMVSPIAYFGAVIGSAFGNALPQASDISKKWWTEFMKYALTVPILGFFLNMTALMANLFTTGGQGLNVVSAEKSLAGSAASSIVSAALTIMTHMIVLLFLIIGMKYAQQSGVIGAGAIVDFAQKGTKGTFKALGKGVKSLGSGLGAGKDYLSSKAAAKFEAKGKTGLAGATRIISQPALTGKLLKEKAADIYKSRITKPSERRANITEQGIRGTLGMDQKANTKAWAEQQKEQDLKNKGESELQGLLKGAMGKADSIDSGAIMATMLDNGMVDEAVDAAKQSAIDSINGTKFASEAEKTAKLAEVEEKFTKDAEGLRAALDHLAEVTKMSTADQKELSKRAETAAKKDPKFEDYQGVSKLTRDDYENVERREDRKRERVEKKARKGLTYAHAGGNFRQVLQTDDQGNIKGYHDDFARSLATADRSVLRDKVALGNLRSSADYGVAQAGYYNGGRDSVFSKMLETMTADEARKAMNDYDRLYMYKPDPNKPNPNILV